MTPDLDELALLIRAEVLLHKGRWVSLLWLATKLLGNADMVAIVEAACQHRPDWFALWGDRKVKLRPEAAGNTLTPLRRETATPFDPIKVLSTLLSAAGGPSGYMGSHKSLDCHVYRDLGLREIMTTFFGRCEARLLHFYVGPEANVAKGGLLSGAITIPRLDAPVVYVRVAPGIWTWRTAPEGSSSTYLIEWDNPAHPPYGSFEFKKGLEVWLDGNTRRQTVLERTGPNQARIYHRGQVSIWRDEYQDTWTKDRTLSVVRAKEPGLLGTPQRGDTGVLLADLSLPTPSRDEAINLVCRLLRYASILAREIEEK